MHALTGAVDLARRFEKSLQSSLQSTAPLGQSSDSPENTLIAQMKQRQQVMCIRKIQQRATCCSSHPIA